MEPSAQKIRREHIELVTIYEIGKLLSSSLDIDRTFQVVLNVLGIHLGFNRALVLLSGDDGNLRLQCSIGMTAERLKRGQWERGGGVVGRVLARGAAIVVPDVAEEPLLTMRQGAFSSENGEHAALIAVPIRALDETHGVLVGQRLIGDLTRLDDDLRVLTMVAGLMGQSIQLNKRITEEQARLREETRRLEKAVRRRYSIDNVVGASPRMQEVFAEVHQAAPSRSTVLIRGESGTGKEAIARALHELSPRKGAPFVTVNCAALSETLLESELFGHEKGAFTGANSDRKGRFELAHGGTLFLDEIGDISANFQAKLLRILQEREFERVGGSRSIKIDVRLVCATNRNLEKMIQRGEFRADLYYRINVVSIFLPPLRERREDIPLLVKHFVDRFNRENDRGLGVSNDAMRVLANCYWPGNVRELENCIERTATMARGDAITAINFPCQSNRCLTQVLHHVEREDAVVAHAHGTAIASVPIPPLPVRPAAPAASLPEGPVRVGPVANVPAMPDRQYGGNDAPDGDRERLIWALEQCGWVQAKAARLLHVTPRQLAYALQKHRIEVRKF